MTDTADTPSRLRPTEGFATLPQPKTAEGEPRRVGVELEFGGIDEMAAARIVARRFGGEIVDAEEPGLALVKAEAGKFEVYLDTSLRKRPQTRAIAEMARSLIPVEIVAPPIPVADLPKIDAVVADLREAGAKGTDDSVLLGFGMHLNVQVASLDAAGIGPVLRAFLLLEDWLRQADPIDPSRRMLPFVDPFDRAFITEAARDGAGWDLDAIFDAYLRHVKTRNRALDLLPVLKFIDEDRVLKAVGEHMKIGARPAFHYRLPDCRVDDPRWSVAHEWARWTLVEEVAADPGTLDALSEAWLKHWESWSTVRGDWWRSADAVLVERGHLHAEGAA